MWRLCLKVICRHIQREFQGSFVGNLQHDSPQPLRKPCNPNDYRVSSFLPRRGKPTRKLVLGEHRRTPPSERALGRMVCPGDYSLAPRRKYSVRMERNSEAFGFCSSGCRAKASNRFGSVFQTIAIAVRMFRSTFFQVVA